MSSTTSNGQTALSFAAVSKDSCASSAAQSDTSPKAIDNMYTSIRSFWTERRRSWWSSRKELDVSRLNDSYLSTYGSLNMP
ncbi:hypothetical protein QR680_002145 [Steinernema hermaphroditum]|uniref:Uncharacterized protein n=1 Tax=Steinernema hermaphroditum TaxID=289476 RepID=A0AA39LHL9_9BILA|nr:hypothetical protein QR680_002145 [Steinernema hermaphroditum]